jgi:hypothetical protein
MRSGYSLIRPVVAIRPILSAIISTNHTAPSGLTAMPTGPALAVGNACSTTSPDGVILPSPLPEFSVNHSEPSDPATIKEGPASGAGSGCSVKAPSGVILPIWFALSSVNHSAPSGPAVIPNGLASGVGRGYSSMEPSVEIRPILLARCSVNQSAPSGPAAITAGPASAVWREYGDLAPRGNPPDSAAAHLGEPERAVRPCSDAVWPRSPVGERIFFDHDTSFGAYHSAPPRRTRCGDRIALRLPLEKMTCCLVSKLT